MRYFIKQLKQHQPTHFDDIGAHLEKFVDSLLDASIVSPKQNKHNDHGNFDVGSE